MKLLNFGSLNLDYVYHVPDFVQPGETLAAKRRDVIAGGKGLNQSLAAAKAGVQLFHAGCIGSGGEKLKLLLEKNGVDISYIERTDEIQGHAVIQVTDQGENAIILYGGSNQTVTESYVTQILSHFGKGDILLMQNEISCVFSLIDRAFERGMKIVLNPSPMDGKMKTVDFGKISWLLVNEVEMYQLTGEKNPDKVAERLLGKHPRLGLLVTLGKKGSVCYKEGRRHVQDAVEAAAVDTTAAGDTYTGYFIAGLLQKKTIAESMKQAAYAAALCVMKRGASESIPAAEEVKKWREENEDQ